MRAIWCGLVLLCAACPTNPAGDPDAGNAPDAGPSGPATLTVTITAPAGDVPTVTVMGPGFTQDLTATTTLTDLAPGEYVVTAASRADPGVHVDALFWPVVAPARIQLDPGASGDVAVRWSDLGRIWVGSPGRLDGFSLTASEPALTVTPPADAPLRVLGPVAFAADGTAWVAMGTTTRTHLGHFPAPGASNAFFAPDILLSLGDAGPIEETARLLSSGGDLWIAQKKELLRIPAASQHSGAVNPVRYTLPVTVGDAEFDTDGLLWVLAQDLVAFDVANAPAGALTALRTLDFDRDAYNLLGTARIAFDHDRGLWIAGGHDGFTPNLLRLTRESLEDGGEQFPERAFIMFVDEVWGLARLDDDSLVALIRGDAGETVMHLAPAARLVGTTGGVASNEMTVELPSLPGTDVVVDHADYLWTASPDRGLLFAVDRLQLGMGGVQVPKRFAVGTPKPLAEPIALLPAGDAVLAVQPDGLHLVGADVLAAGGTALPTKSWSVLANKNVPLLRDAVLDATGRLWISEARGLLRFPSIPSEPSGLLTPQLVDATIPASGDPEPNLLALAPDGALWTTVAGATYLNRIPASELDLGAWTPQRKTVAATTGGFAALTFDAAGNLWLARARSNEVLRITPEKQASATMQAEAFTLDVGGPTELNRLAFDDAQDLWVLGGALDSSILARFPADGLATPQTVTFAERRAATGLGIARALGVGLFHAPAP